MSSVVSERSWLTGIQRVLSNMDARLRQQVRVGEQDCYQVMDQIRDELSTSMAIWVVDSSSDILAHIACWHSNLESYGGYLLCSDRSGQTFLLNMQTYRFVEAAKALLLQIDGVEQAKCLSMFCAISKVKENIAIEQDDERIEDHLFMGNLVPPSNDALFKAWCKLFIDHQLHRITQTIWLALGSEPMKDMGDHLLPKDDSQPE